MIAISSFEIISSTLNLKKFENDKIMSSAFIYCILLTLPAKLWYSVFCLFFHDESTIISALELYMLYLMVVIL